MPVDRFGVAIEEGRLRATGRGVGACELDA
jgi:hypothetical protein